MMFEYALTAEFKQGEILVSKMKHSKSPCFPIYFPFLNPSKNRIPSRGLQKVLEVLYYKLKGSKGKEKEGKKKKKAFFI